MNPQPGEEPSNPTDAVARAFNDITPLVLAARSGLKADVAALIAGLDAGSLLVPLARPIAGATLGVDCELGDELRLSPLLLPDPAGRLFAVAFSDRDVLQTVAQHLDWKTGDDALQSATLPAKVALELAEQLLAAPEVAGLVINPGDETELVLRHDELASLLQGHPIPLIGYIQHLPDEPGAGTLVSETDGEAAQEIARLAGACVDAFDAVERYQVQQLFDPERDREPHLTLVLFVTSEADHSAIQRYLGERLEGKLPPPGYVDILFRAA